MNRIEFGYEDNLYRIDCSNPSPNFRLYGHGIEIFFTAEWKNKGSYFQIKSVTKNGKTYSAQRYHYKYIPLIREATFEVYKNIGLYDYSDNSFHYFKDNVAMTRRSTDNKMDDLCNDYRITRTNNPYTRTRNAVYATGNKWAIENFNATH